MSLKFYLECAPSFKPKASYSVEMLSLILGEKAECVGEDAMTGDDIVICYGSPEKISGIPGRHIIIPGDESTWRMFGADEQYAFAGAKRCRIDSSDSIALFYDDEFRRFGQTHTTGADGKTVLHIDIVAGAFFFLSGWQEWTSTEHDVHKRFPFEASIQNFFNLIDTPIVDQYAALLADVLTKHGWREPAPGRFSGKEFAVMMTHDIDHIRKWTPGFLLREFVFTLILNRRSIPFKSRIDRIGMIYRYLFSGKDPYIISTDAILKREYTAGAHTTFFIIAGGRDKRDGRRSLDDSSIRSLHKQLAECGHQTGLHPSYHAYSDKEMMSAELENLAGITGQRIGAVREHFLRFSLPLTWRIQDELGFEYDSTLGFPGREGFRMGTCHPFRVYDVEYDRQLALWEIPLVVMDDTLKSYRKLDTGGSWEAIEKQLATVKRYRGVAVLLFHNTCSDELDHPGWDEVFENAVAWSVRNGAALLNGHELLRSYRDISG